MAHVQSIAESSTGTSHTLTFAATPTAGNAIVVLMGLLSGTNVFSSCTDSEGNTYTHILNPVGFNAGRRMYALIAENFAGSGTVVVTLTTSSSVTIHWGIAEYDNVPTSGVVDSFDVASFTSATSATTNNIATSAPSATILSWLRNVSASGGIVPAGGETERQEPSTTFQFQDEAAGAAGNYNAAWTWTNPSIGGWFIMALKSGVVQPVITNVDGDNALTVAQASAVITGTDFGSDGGAAKIELLDGAIVSLCTKNSWTSTSINFDVVLGNCRYGNLVIRITTQAGLTATQAVTVSANGAIQSTDVGTLRTLAFDARGKPTRLTPKSSLADATTDCTAAVQFEVTRSGGSGAFTADPDGRLQWATAVTQVTWRWHNGTVWSAAIVWDLRGPFPVFAGPNIVDKTYTQNSAITSIDHSVLFTYAESLGATYTLQGGAITGLSIGSSTGIESGTPTVVANNTNRKIRSTNGEGSFAESNAFGRNIEAPPNPPFFAGTIGPQLFGTVDATFVPLLAGGFFQFCTSFARTGGVLPPGLTLDTGTGTISGMPTTIGTYAGITVTGSGTGSPAVSNAFTIEILPPSNVIANVVGMNVAEAVTVLAAGGFTPITVFVTDVETFGIVLSQVPVADTVAPLGTVVTLTVSLGSAGADAGLVELLDPTGTGRGIFIARRVVVPETGKVAYYCVPVVPAPGRSRWIETNITDTDEQKAAAIRANLLIP